MKKILILVVLATAGFAGTGFYRGWFRMTSQGGDKPNVTVTVDKDKIHDDEKKAAGEVQRSEHKVVESVHGS